MRPNYIPHHKTFCPIERWHYYYKDELSLLYNVFSNALQEKGYNTINYDYFIKYMYDTSSGFII